jgi:hypothetical protein
MSSATCWEAAKSLIAEIGENGVTDAFTIREEPHELTALRKRLFTDCKRLSDALAHPDEDTAGYLSLDDLFWTARFAWADLQDFIEEANNKVINDAAGFRSEWLCVKKLEDGTIVPDRPRRRFLQTMEDHAAWLDSDAYPITAWDDEDYEAATCW